jgi:hypothetical protein
MLSLFSSLCLAFASPIRTTAAIVCLTLVVGRDYQKFWLSVENHCFTKTKKTTKSIKHLGGKW